MTHDHDNILPRGALILAAGLVLGSLALTAGARIAGLPPAASPALLRAEAGTRAVVSRDLRFLDQADGSVMIEDVVAGRPAAVIEAGSESGFIRGVMRGLARERKMNHVGPGPAFRLTLWADGALSLADSATGRIIDLGAFGATNRAAFAALLPERAR